MYLYLSSSLKYPWEEARTTCKNYHCNFTWCRAVEWLLQDLQLHRLQHHLLHCSSLTALLLAEWLTCSHLVLHSADSQTNRVWILTGWPGRQTYRIWREWCLGEGQVGWADLIWLWLWHLSLLLWRLCEFPVGLPCLFYGPLTRPFSTELWSHSFCSPTYPLSGPPIPSKQVKSKPLSMHVGQTLPAFLLNQAQLAFPPNVFVLCWDYSLPGVLAHVHPIFDGYLLICQYLTQKSPLLWNFS